MGEYSYSGTLGLFKTPPPRYEYGIWFSLCTVVFNPNTETYTEKFVMETCQRTRGCRYNTSRRNPSFRAATGLHNYQSFHNTVDSHVSISVANTAPLHHVSALQGKRGVTSLHQSYYKGNTSRSPYDMALHSTGQNSREGQLYRDG
jgi:hypothetical protein